ncbi:MAG: tetratricopeptide repeat protein [Archangium sp.]|nr:tetratricopeptide repeat protein [Archangium sp.]
MTASLRRSILLFLLVLAVPSLAQTVPELYRQSYALEARGDPAGALKAMEAVVARTPDYVATLRRAWLLYLVGRYTDATVAYGKAIALEPKAVEPKLGAMLPAMALRRWKEAERLGTEVLSASPGEFLAVSRLAFIHFEQARWDKAEAFYRQALALFPANVEMQTGLAWTWLRQGKADEARAGFQRVLQVAPDSASAEEGLAQLTAR